MSKSLIFIFTVFLFIFIHLGSAKTDNRMRKIILIGASIGEGWNFDNISERIDVNEEFKFISFYSGDAIEKAKSSLQRGDGVILKLCAVNFRVYELSDTEKILNQYKKAFIDWSQYFAKNGIETIFATVIPITYDIPLYYKLRHFIKSYIFFKNSEQHNRVKTQELISEFNNWVREYSLLNNIRVLDLAYAVQIDKNNPYLKEEMSTDGVHLNNLGYSELDRLAKSFFATEINEH